MPRRKQDCPKRMKWEGGEECDEEDGASQDSKTGGDDADSSPDSPMSPASATSHSIQEDEQPVPLTPGATSPDSPISTSPMIVDGIEPDADLPLSMIQDPLRGTPISRCPSRDSRASSVPRDCPSRDSQCSDRGVSRITPIVLPAISPVAVALPTVLPSSASSGLLPPNTAALAAYLGAAAVVAQQTHHRLLMTPPGLPRASVSPLLSSSSPPILPLSNPLSTSPPLRSPAESDSSTVLDFSTKRSSSGKPDELEGDSALNLSKPTTPVLSNDSHLNSPLDLSVSSSRKRGHDDSSSLSTSVSSQSPSPQHHLSSKRSSRLSADFKAIASPWTSPVVASHFPFIAAAVAAANNSLSPKSNSSSSHNAIEPPVWNGKLKLSEKESQFVGMPTPSDATKALEQMSKLSKFGGGGDDLFRPVTNSSNISNSGIASVGNSNTRHSAWQSHWLNKGAESAKDVLKCVWCKQSFPSLAAMTAHMKEAKHCGVNVPPPHVQAPSLLPPQAQQPPISSPALSVASVLSSGSLSNSISKPSQSDLNLLIKETMPLPRKLVRGQDVWLGKGAEQTRQILKCMWCGQSFRSLAEMTSHMQQTQHYTNIISQEQIISWKSSDDNTKSSGGPGGGPTGATGPGASSTVSAVLTCKVCDQAFSSLKELSNHMVKNSHYKEHIMRSITESGGRRRQTREKRKKSLPVRKLLELERAQHELKNGEGGILIGNGGKIGRDIPATGRITCEKCGDKIETSIFVDHIRQCVGGGSISSSQRNLLKNALLSNNIIHPDNPIILAQLQEHERKSICEDSVTPISRHHRSPSLATDLSTTSNKESNEKHSSGDTASSSSASVLNAIEKLIEKSFDSRTRHSAVTGFGAGPGGMGASPMGSSILKRLGIDESVDYTKPLVDAQTMNILRSYHHHHSQHQHHHYSNRRERSGSESSSISDRGGGRIDTLTPDRKPDPSERILTSTPRATPEKRIQTPSPPNKSFVQDDLIDDKVKREPVTDDEREDTGKSLEQKHVVVKKEVQENEDDDDDRGSFHSTVSVLPRERRDDVPITPGSTDCNETREEDTEETHNDDGRRSHSSVGVHSPGLSPHNQTPLTPAVVDTNAGLQNSPCRNSTSSPASSDRSGTPRSTASAEKKASNNGGTSLVALSTMFDSLSGGASSSADGGNTSSSRGSSSHPLAALQKLCDKTERHSSNRSSSNVGASSVTGHSSVGGGSGQSGGGTTPGAILAFSWACNDAVVTADSIMKCAFCDTPFISKGAYRHHLSKMHFVKDGAIPDPVTLKVQHQAASSSALPSSLSSGKGGSILSTVSATANASGSNCSAAGSSGKSPQQNFEESPHSKFLKYTELAKQLSSKYV